VLRFAVTAQLRFQMRSTYQNTVLLCSTCLNSVKDVSARRIGCRVAELNGVFHQFAVVGSGSGI
jgi:hypothetical protein